MEVKISETIQAQLTKLRSRDPDCKISGAGTHRYQSTPVDPETIEVLESALGTALPPEYQKFLIEVGYGAGPYYGIWSPSESLTEIQGLMRDYEEEAGQALLPSAPFPLDSDELLTISARSAAEDKTPALERDWPCSGCLPICHHGCTFWSVLVLTGKFRGPVWDVACFVGYTGEWMPARRPPGWHEIGQPHPIELPPLPHPPTFYEWFTGWLERGLSDLQ